MTSRHSHRHSSLALGWEAAKANFGPALAIQVLMLSLLTGYYFSPRVAQLLNELAAYKMRHGLPFVLLAAVAAGALAPEVFLILFFQRGRINRRNVRNLLFTIPIWALDGILVDLLYRGEAAWLGNVVTFSVVFGKICLDQFGYNVFLAAPLEVLIYEWKNTGFSLESLGRGLTWDHYRDKVIPTLLATWSVWIPLMAIIYSLPLALQFPLFSLGLTFWVLLLTYMTNSFALAHSATVADAVTPPPAIAQINP